MNDVALSFTEAELLMLLPANVREGIQGLSADGASWEDIGFVLGVGPHAGIALKGGAAPTTALWGSVKKEVHSFLCTDSKAYADLRKEWKGLAKQTSTTAVSALSVLVASQLGVAAGLISPLVIFALVVVLRIGKEAACQAMSAPTTDAQPPKQQLKPEKK